LNNSKTNEISDNEFKKQWLIKEIKQNMYKHLNELKEYIKTQLSELKVN
jgi:hypothetical protein